MQSKDEQTGENVASHEENATDLKIDSTCRDGVASHGSVVARVNHGKTMNAVASSLRVDRVAATALGMGRKYVMSLKKRSHGVINESLSISCCYSLNFIVLLN